MTLPGRRAFLQGSLALAGLSLAAGCSAVRMPWQQPARLRRIGTLGDAPNAQWAAFRDGLKELGYVEGENIAVESRWAEGEYDRFAAHAAELVGLDVECIVAGGITVAIPAKPVNTTIPMVAILNERDAVEAGLVANIARPEGNITGIAGLPGFLLHAKLAEILKETIPDARRVAVLAFAQQHLGLDGIEDAARQLGLQLEIAMVQGPDGIEPAFSAIGAAGVQALVIIHTSIFGTARAQIAGLARAHRLPSFTSDVQFPPVGGLLGYGVDRLDNYRHAATYVDKILRGAKPADLPMERPRTFEFILNLKTAQAPGLTIPPSVLRQATEVIQ